MNLPAPGDRVGPYVVDVLAGRGAMGAVFRARDSRLERVVALKLLVSLEHRDAVARFAREARVLAALDHRYIGRIYELGAEGELTYLALEWIEGESLRDRMLRGDLSFAEKRRILRCIADALDHAHRNGVLHRDIKPANVMLGANGAVKVVDFGIAKPIRAEGDKATFATEQGVALGTPRYMSPEQHNLEPASASTDQFAWAVLAYELLSGAHPPLASTNGVFPFHRPPPLPPDIPTPLAGVIDRAISPKASDRYATMSELVAALRDTERPRRKSLFGVSLAITILAGAGLVAFLFRAPAELTITSEAGPVPAPLDAADLPVVVTTAEPEVAPVDATVASARRPPRRADRSLHRCECWSSSERLCAMVSEKPKCGCWWDPPGQSKVVGCPINRALIPGNRCKSYAVKGRAGDKCQTFISQDADLGDLEVTGRLACTLCERELVDLDPAESGIKTGQSCHGFSGDDGKAHDGTWDCVY